MTHPPSVVTTITAALDRRRKHSAVLQAPRMSEERQHGLEGQGHFCSILLLRSLVPSHSMQKEEEIEGERRSSSRARPPVVAAAVDSQQMNRRRRRTTTATRSAALLLYTNSTYHNKLPSTHTHKWPTQTHPSDATSRISPKLPMLLLLLSFAMYM